MATKQIPTEEQVIGWMDSLSNWGRWGDDDQMGTLNLITNAKRAQAAALVKEGISVTCSRPISPGTAADVTTIPPPPDMNRAGEPVPPQGRGRHPHHTHAKIAAHHLFALDQSWQNLLHPRRGNGQTDPVK